MYVVIGVLISTRFFSRMNPQVSRLAFMTVVAHWFITNLYIAFAVVLAVAGWKSFTIWFFVTVLLTHIAVVIGFKFAKVESDSARKISVKWVVAAPLLLGFIPAAGFAALFMLIQAIDKPILWGVNILLVIAMLVYLRNVAQRMKKKR